MTSGLCSAAEVTRTLDDWAWEAAGRKLAATPETGGIVAALEEEAQEAQAAKAFVAGYALVRKAEEADEAPAPEAPETYEPPRLSWKQIEAIPPHERKAYAKARGKKLKAESDRLIASVLADDTEARTRARALNALSPCAEYSARNFLLVIAAGTTDARSFSAWKQAGRKVRKGAKAIYVWVPRNPDEANGDRPFTAFKPYPLFRVEDTDGADIEYQPMEATGETRLIECVEAVSGKAFAA